MFAAHIFPCSMYYIAIAATFLFFFIKIKCAFFYYCCLALENTVDKSIQFLFEMLEYLTLNDDEIQQ
jgi:hypothetical protein